LSESCFSAPPLAPSESLKGAERGQHEPEVSLWETLPLDNTSPQESEPDKREEGMRSEAVPSLPGDGKCHGESFPLPRGACFGTAPTVNEPFVPPQCEEPGVAVDERALLPTDGTSDCCPRREPLPPTQLLVLGVEAADDADEQKDPPHAETKIAGTRLSGGGRKFGSYGTSVLAKEWDMACIGVHRSSGSIASKPTSSCRKDNILSCPQLLSTEVPSTNSRKELKS